MVRILREHTGYFLLTMNTAIVVKLRKAQSTHLSLTFQSLDHQSLHTVQLLQMTDIPSRQILKGALAMDLHGGRSIFVAAKQKLERVATNSK